MKTFSLSSDFSEFDWNSSNGSATQAQTIQAHYALMYKSLCSKFSRYVWNDIVSVTYKLLTELKMEWDSTYRTLGGTKLQSEYEPFFASIFNSLVLNISRVIPTTWKWQFDADFEGFIGREFVRGVTSNPENPDTVYASYLLELVRKLNLLIEICKGNADYSAFKSIPESTAEYSAEVSGLQSAGMASLNKHNLTSSATVQSAIGATIQATQRMRSGYVSSMELMTPPQSLRATIKAISAVSAEMEFYRFYSRMAYTDATESIANATLLRKQSKTFDVVMTAAAYIKKSLLELSGILGMASNVNSILGINTSELIYNPPKPLSATTAADMALSELICKLIPPKRMTSYIASYAYSQPSLLIAVSPIYLEQADRCMTAELSATVIARKLTDLRDALISAKADVSSDLKKIRPVMASASSVAKVTENAVITSGKMLNLGGSTVSSDMRITASFDKTSPLRLAVYSEIYSSTNADLISISAVELKTNTRANSGYTADLDTEKDTWLDPIQTGTDLYIRSAYLQFMIDKSVHIDSPAKLDLSTDTSINADYSAGITELITMRSNVDSAAEIEAELDNGSIWYDPEQDGTNLYIPQSYIVTAENNNLEVK